MGPDPEAKRENTASGRAGPPAGAPVRVPRRAWWDHPWRAVGGLCVLVCVSRLPFRTPMLTSWDAAQFALAMEDFDVARHRPHPPGYLPLVAAARAIDLLVHDANASLVLVAIVFSMLGVIAVYGLGRAMFDGRVGVTAALLYAISPLHWALGEVALPYTAEGALCAAVAWLLWHSRQGSGRHAIAAGLVLGLGAGFRTNLLLFLLPALVYALWPLRRRTKLVAVVALAIGCIAWLGPTIALTGGYARYVDASGALAERLVLAKSVPALLRAVGSRAALAQLAQNTDIVCGSLFGGGLALAAVLLLPLGRWHDAEPSARHGRRWFCAVVLLPASAFYILVHMARKGYVMTLVPVLLVLAAANAAGLAMRLRLRVRWIVGAIALGNACLFIALYPPQDRSDVEALRGKLLFIEQHFDPADTVVIDFPDFRLLGYYLRDFQVYALPGFATPGADDPGSQVGEWGMRYGREQFDEMVPVQPVVPRPLAFAPRVHRVVFTDERYLVVRQVPMRELRFGRGRTAGVVELTDVCRVFHYDVRGGWFRREEGAR